MSMGSKLVRKGRDRLRVGRSFVGPSMTKQAEADDADINKILERMLRTGELRANMQPPRFGDFADAGTYHEALNILQNANDHFDSLDAKLRSRFDNDPSKFLAFVGDHNNMDEAINLGLIRAEVVERVSSEKAKKNSKAAPKGDPDA